MQKSTAISWVDDNKNTFQIYKFYNCMTLIYETDIDLNDESEVTSSLKEENVIHLVTWKQVFTTSTESNNEVAKIAERIFKQMKYNNEVATYNETLNERIIEQQSIGEKDKGMEWIFISYRKFLTAQVGLYYK